MSLKPAFAAAVLSTTLIGSGASASQEACSMVGKYFTAFNEHDVNTLTSFYAEDAVLEDPETTEPKRGHAAIREHFEQLFSIAPDVRDEVSNVICQGNLVAVEFVSHGHFLGENGSKQAFRLKVAAFLTYRGGKIVKDVTYFDRAAL